MKPTGAKQGEIVVRPHLGGQRLYPKIKVVPLQPVLQIFYNMIPKSIFGQKTILHPGTFGPELKLNTDYTRASQTGWNFELQYYRQT
jgi:hypothetical protein